MRSSGGAAEREAGRHPTPEVSPAQRSPAGRSDSPGQHCSTFAGPGYNDRNIREGSGKVFPSCAEAAAVAAAGEGADCPFSTLPRYISE